MTTTIVMRTAICIPRLPNFLFLNEPADGAEVRKIGVADISEDALRQIGAAWTQALIDHAKQRRAALNQGNATKCTGVTPGGRNCHLEDGHTGPCKFPIRSVRSL